MNTVRYCTPEWLEESAKGYHANPKYQKEFAKMTLTLCFRVKAESTWGIDEDIIFGADVEKGKLNKLVFFSEEAAKAEAEYIVAATPRNGKRSSAKRASL